MLFLCDLQLLKPDTFHLDIWTQTQAEQLKTAEKLVDFPCVLIDVCLSLIMKLLITRLSLLYIGEKNQNLLT
jgi:hypothetical protein